MNRTGMRMAGIGLVIAAVAMPAGRGETAKQYTLSYRMDKGTTFGVQVERKHRNYRNFMGNELTTNTEERKEYELTAQSSHDDGSRLELEYVQWETNIQDAQVSVRPDFSELIGRRVRMLLSPTGVVSDFEGFDDLPAVTIPGQGDPVGDELRYTNEAIYLFPRLPEAPVAPGDSWSVVVQFDEAVGDTTLPLTVDYTYTLVEETRFDNQDCLKIEGEYTIRMSGPLAVGGLDLELNLAGTGTDTIYFAWKKGMFLSAESRATFKGSADNEEMGVTIPMDHKIETVATVSLD